MKIGDAIHTGVTQITKPWTTYRRKELRDERRGARARAELMRGSVREPSIKQIANAVMADAYLKASSGGTLPASARQIMYQARSLILDRTDKTLGKDFDQYFTQQLLPAFLRDFPGRTAGWDVVFDARGHLWEPHTDCEIQLGTLAVRDYLGDIDDKVAAPGIPGMPETLPLRYPTHGPTGRYRDVLLIEKEGFLPLLRAAQIAERFDVAIMSTKGVATTAARTLMEGLDGVRFLVVRDFDKGGFTIVGTLQRDTERYQFENPPEVVDLGLRGEDVEAEDLPSEPVHYHERFPQDNLRENGATEAEIDFLVTGYRRGQRVELNAFSSERFIAWLEQKLEAHGVEKLIPDAATLAAAYRRAMYFHAINADLRRLHATAAKQAQHARVPAGLRRYVTTGLAKQRTRAWDDVVAERAAKRWTQRSGGRK